MKSGSLQPSRDRDSQSDGPKLYSIGAAARFAGFHPQTLRWYEKKGLIKPMRTAGNVRRYTQEDIAQLFRIRSLSKRGVALEAVRQILALEEERRKLYELVESLERELDRLRSAPKPARSGRSRRSKYDDRHDTFGADSAAGGR